MGLIIAAQALPTIFALPMWATFADRYGASLALTCTLFCAALGWLLQGSATSLLGLGLARLWHAQCHSYS